MSTKSDANAGMMMGTAKWIEFNTLTALGNAELRDKIAPFPPDHLMRNVSGLTSESDFAAHGAALYQALQKASPKDLSSYEAILDFGCGCGRLARYFKGHPGTIAGCDVDPSHVAWTNENLPYMRAELTKPNQALPFADYTFDCVISISVFTHIDERSQFFYLSELARCTKPGAYLFLTVHGERAMSRAQNENSIFDMLEIPADRLKVAAMRMMAGDHAFILQNGHLTTADYNYGITFIPFSYVQKKWAAYFDIVGVASGAIHDFQDIVICRRS